MSLNIRNTFMYAMGWTKTCLIKIYEMSEDFRTCHYLDKV